MQRFTFGRRAPAEPPKVEPPKFDVEPPKPEVETKEDLGSDGSGGLKPQSNGSVTEDRDQEQVKADSSPKEDSPKQEDAGDYIGVRSRSHVKKILDKQGDKRILFADKVLRFTCSGKMKKRLLIITDFALYIVDPETDLLRRRIALAAVEKLCLSKLKDNFLAIIIPTEYDVLMASTRKTEIATVLVDATKSASDYELEVSQSNRFEYNAAAEEVKEVQFEEVEGGVKTRIVKK